MDNAINIKSTNDPIKFKEESIILLLNKLEQKGIIKDVKDKETLFNIYNTDKRDLNIIFNEIKKLTKDEAQKIINSLKQEKSPISNKISLDNITDFTNEQTGKKYISIHYPYPEDKVKVVENLSDKSAKELFEEKKDADGLVSVDGFVSATDVYETQVEPDKNEVKMYNVTELAKRGEFKKLSKDGKQNVIGLVTTIVNELSGINEEQRRKLRNTPVEELVKLLNKDVLISPNENIVIICTPNSPQDDKIMTVTKDEKGEYKLTSLNATGYGYIGKTEEQEIEEENDLNEEKEKEKEEFGTSMRKKAPWEKKRAS